MHHAYVYVCVCVYGHQAPHVWSQHRFARHISLSDGTTFNASSVTQAVSPPYWPRFVSAPGEPVFEAWGPPPPPPPPPAAPAPPPPPQPISSADPFDFKDSPTAPPLPETAPPSDPFIEDLNVTTLALIADEIPRFSQVAGVQFMLQAAGPAPCSVACGSGLAVASATCVSTAMHTSAPLEVCRASLAAPDGRLAECNTTPCPEQGPHWEVGAWGRSDARCGGGLRSRAVQCMVNGTATPSSAPCGLLPLQQYLVSNTAPCVPFAWATTPWSSCSKDCGWGVVRRSSTCVSSSGAVLPTAYCPVPAPETEMECYLRPCDTSLRGSAGAAQRTAAGIDALPTPASALEPGDSRPQATLRRLLLDSELEEQEAIKYALVSACGAVHA